MRPSIRRLVQTLNAYCPTGKGGGRDNSCSSAKGSKKSAISAKVKPYLSHLPATHIAGAKIEVRRDMGYTKAEYWPGGSIRVSKDLLDTRYFPSNTEGTAYYQAHPKAAVSISRSYSRDYDLPDRGDVTDQYIRHILTHEVGHRVYHEVLTPQQQAKAARLFSKISTPTIGAYQGYVQDRGDQYERMGLSRDAPVLTQKVAREQFAEAYRQWQLNGKHKALFKKLGLKV